VKGFGLGCVFGIAKYLLGSIDMYRRILQSVLHKGENMHLLDSLECGYGSVEGSCEYGSEPSGMIKVRFYGQLFEYLASEEQLGLHDV
jgi:hypothetical protein